MACGDCQVPLAKTHRHGSVEPDFDPYIGSAHTRPNVAARNLVGLIVELNRADSRSAVRRWVAVGVIAASNLLVLGAVLGVVLARVLK